MSGANGNGFVPLRRGILEHCRQGKLPPMAFAIYTLLILEADKTSGVAWSSAKSVALTYGYNERTARTSMEKLEDGGYIKRFTVPGRHGEYGIAVNKYLVTHGARSGMTLNAGKSIDLEHLAFDRREENSKEHVNENVKERSPYQEREVKLSSPPAPPGQNGHLQPQSQNGNESGKHQHDPFEDVVRELLPFYLKNVRRARYDIEAQSELSRKSTRLQFLAAKAKQISERIVLREAPGLEEATILQNTLSAMEHVITVFSRNEWRATEGRKFNGLEYAFRDFGRIESALEESA